MNADSLLCHDALFQEKFIFCTFYADFDSSKSHSHLIVTIIYFRLSLRQIWIRFEKMIPGENDGRKRPKNIQNKS